MYLRTVAGRYAGELRNYGIVAGLAALRSGTAVRPDAPVVSAVKPEPAAKTPATKKTAKR